jgi:hypothetical protein
MSSDGRTLKIICESAGHAKLTDDHGRTIHFEYDSDLTLPSKVLVESIGSISPTFSKDGSISSGDGDSEETKKVRPILDSILELIPDYRF